MGGRACVVAAEEGAKALIGADKLTVKDVVVTGVVVVSSWVVAVAVEWKDGV